MYPQAENRRGASSNNTEIAFRNARPRAKPYKISAGEGMYLLVIPDGNRYWRLKYRYGGREKVLALGVYPEVSLKRARELRNAAKSRLAAGVDPVQERRETKLAARVARANTFEAIAREWHEHRKARGHWDDTTARKIIGSLEADVFPDLGPMPIGSINGPILLATLKKIERRGSLEILSRVKQRCGAVFRYAISTSRATYNPVPDLREAVQTHRPKNHRALTVKELPAFLVALESYPGQPLTKLALKLLVLTFVRPGELRGARWSEFDLETAEWRIPAERMKMNEPHVVPLSRQTLDLIEEIQALTGDRPLLFPSQNGEGRSLSENTLCKAIDVLGFGALATAHGFRATASTILNDAGWRPDVIERQLSHRERNQVRATYNRATYLAERRLMMQTWADILDGYRSGVAVIPLGVRNDRRAAA